MPRTIAALYDSRPEAEIARAQLISGVKARFPRIIGKDTIGALEGLEIAASDLETYREGVSSGGYLLVAQIPRGTSADRVIELVVSAIGHGAEEESQDLRWDEQGVRVELPTDIPLELTPADSVNASEIGQDDLEPEVDSTPPIVPEEERPVATQEPAREGARVRAHTHDVPAEEQVALKVETIEVENRVAERKLSESEVEAGGLFKERVFEIAEMREEPVVTKIAVVHEEVIVRKIVKERTETIRDSVRQTQVEVEDLPLPEEEGPGLFGSDKRGGR